MLVFIAGDSSGTISRLGHDREVNTHTINMHVRNMALVKLFDIYINKTLNSRVFQIDDVYVPTGTCTYITQLESVRAK